MDMVTIQGIDCYGEFDECSNVNVVGWRFDDVELDEIWCNDTGESTWEGAVRELKAWADRMGYTIEELKSC